MTLLTVGEAQRYHRDGFLPVKRLADDQEVEWLAQLCSALLATSALRRDLAGPPGSGQTDLPQLLYPERAEPKVLSTRFFASATALGAELMGRDDLDWFTHFIVKPARGGASTAWHQDVAYDPVLRRPGCSVWLALDEATADNGCLQFVPGSQRGPIMRHRPVGGDPSAEGMEATDVDTAAAVTVPVPRGGGSVHGHRVLHAAGPNKTSSDRRAYIVVGIAPG
jgi:Phytanoyl-CoA dioxygenase (PhyH)